MRSSKEIVCGEKSTRPRMEFGEYKHLRGGEPRKIRKTWSAGKR